MLKKSGLPNSNRDTSREYLEYQIKFPTNLTEKDILAAGAKRLASIICEDKYYLQPRISNDNGPSLIRVRKENGNSLNFSFRKEITADAQAARGAVVSNLSQEEFNNIKKDFTHVLDINKRRIIYVLGTVVINYDVVEPLGTYIELVVSEAKDYEKLLDAAKKLKLPLHTATSQTYFQLAYTKTDVMQKLLSSLTSRLGRFSFGIASGVLTTLGVIIVMNKSVVSLLAIIAGIVAIAVADSMSDAFGVYSLKKTERGTAPRSAFAAAIATFLGKVVCTLTFIIPFLLLPIDTAVIVSIFWGVFLLIIVNLEIAVIQQESIWKTILVNLLLAGLVMFLSLVAGNFLAGFG